MGQRTPLYAQHIAAGAKLVDFAGWEMPIHYGSQLQEHYHVRQDAGMFDVSHMAVVDVTGEGAKDFLQYLLANNTGRLQPSQALYSCMLNDNGGVIDDLIVYYVTTSPLHYRMIVNAATCDKDLAWMKKQCADFNVNVVKCDDVAMIAVQGPNARAKLDQALPTELIEPVGKLKRFSAYAANDWFIGRTGYTGEDGVEIILPATFAGEFWERLIKAGVSPCGLGARDTLRLEAGMNLYGTDMDESVTPLESGLAWTIAWEPEIRDFIGREALTKQKAKGVEKRLIGLILETKGVLRNHQRVICEGSNDGEITSGSFSPTLNCAVALARIPVAFSAKQCAVDVRGKMLPAQIVKLPFVRNGKCVCE